MTTIEKIALQEFKFDQTWIQENIKVDSVLVFDDFYCNKDSLPEFRRVVNYYCRHKSLTFFILLHSIFKSNIFNEINLASHLFLLKSNSGRQVATRKKVLKQFNTLISTKTNKQVLYVNLIDEYCVSFKSDILNNIIIPLKMFLNEHTYTIHKTDEPCSDSAHVETTESSDLVDNDIYQQYSSRNKRKIFFILTCFKKNKILQDDLVILSQSHFMHIYDVLSIFLNPFSKNEVSKKELLFIKKLKTSTKTFPLPRHVIPMHLRKYL